MAIRILITDDHGLMRAGLRAMLENRPGIELVGEAANGADMLRLAAETSPDIVLLDIGLPDMDGIEATRRLKSSCLQTQVLLITVYEEESLLREAIKVGASGYIIKRAAGEELIDAIQAVMRGDLYIHPALTRMLLKNLNAPVEAPLSQPAQPTAPADGKRDALQSLTQREAEVMRYIIKGLTNRQIAEGLEISVRTVEGHRASLFNKLGLKNRVELVEFAEKMQIAE